MFIKLIKIRLIDFICLTLLLSLSSLSCAPISSDDLCSVHLVPNKIISKRYHESIITINCEATIDLKNSTDSAQFSNPVFDLSFGGAPRTGVFIIRGNKTCDEKETKCWSEFKLAADSIGRLIQHRGDIEFSCNVADQLKNEANDRLLARCENKGYLKFSNVLKFGDSCSQDDIEQECDINMECGESESESVSEEQCICKSGFTSIPKSNKNTICVEEAIIDSNCNYTKQCTAVDPNTVCKRNEFGIKVCQCNENSYLYSEYETDYKKTCQIKPTSTPSPTTEDAFGVVLPNNTNEESNSGLNSGVKKSEELIEDEKGSMGEYLNKTKKSEPNKSDAASNLGIIFFFLAILLAILIVVIIIRVRNKSAKMTVNKKRKNTEQQTDCKDGEQSEPILSQNKDGVDEIDDDYNDGDKQAPNNGIATQHTSSGDEQNSNSNNNEQTLNKLNNKSQSNESLSNQKIQTNV